MKLLVDLIGYEYEYTIKYRSVLERLQKKLGGTVERHLEITLKHSFIKWQSRHYTVIYSFGGTEYINP